MAEKSKTLLDGVRVIEMSHVMAAPATGLMLADMGADVIKVERLPLGDDVRRLAPYVDEESAPFAMMNRNKRSIGLNLKTDEGKAALKKLIKGADVFIENYRQGAMEHYGVGYEQVKADNPGLIYCSISGYGRTGPYAEKGGFDLVAQGMSGLMSITGESAERPPVKVGAPVTDITAGTLGAMGILAALFHKAQTGEGQFVDTSLFEAGIMHTYWQSAIFMASGELPVAMGSAHPLMAPYQAFQTSDGWLNIGSANQGLWQKLTALLGVPELADDERFREPKDRMENLAELVDELTGFFKTDTTDAWQQKLEDAGIPAGPVLNIEQMTANEQTLARDMVADVGSSQGSSLRVLGHPVKYSETPAAIQRRAPGLGEHTEEVLAEFGFTEAEIEELRGQLT
ncbi:MAG: CoA transferase [Rhodospirillaceae bacterium]|nr:CoA transferase [Rhodospirillaceae bacterium]MBT7956315.1 CoA transferase [Rhodospirillaceae bacterium]